MRKFLLLLPFVLMFAACSQTELQVMSYNMRQGNSPDGINHWDNRCHATLSMLREAKPDVFGVQEAHGYQVSYITDSLPCYRSVGVGRDDGFEKGERMSVFYNSDKFELLDWGTYWLSDTPDEPSKGWDAAYPRTATWTRLKMKKGGREFFYVNTHLDHIGAQARRNGLILIVDRIAAMNPDGLPMVLTGDFNTTEDDPCLDDLDLRMKSARREAPVTDTGITYNGFGKEGELARAIDYIYYSGFDSCDNFRVLRDSYDGIPYISDHYPITVTLKF